MDSIWFRVAASAVSFIGAEKLNSVLGVSTSDERVVLIRDKAPCARASVQARVFETSSVFGARRTAGVLAGVMVVNAAPFTVLPRLGRHGHAVY
jgi:hypothetical protein